MSRTIAVSLFFILLFASLLGLSLSLAPGLSVKNAYLYSIIVYLLARSAIENRSVSVLDEPIPFASFHIIFLVLIFWAACSWLFMILVARHIEYDGFVGLIRLKGKLVDLYLVCAAFFFIIRDKEDVLWTAKAIVLLVTIYNLLTFLDAFNLLDFGLIGDIQGTKEWGPMGHSNSYASFIIFFLPCMVAMASISTGYTRLVFAIGAAVSGILLIVTFARGAYFGLALGFLATGYIYRAHLRLSTYVRYVFLAIAGLTILVVITGQWENLYDRIFDTTARAANIDDISSGRIGIWSAALAKQMESPVSLVLGTGWDSYEQSRWFYYATHNTFLNYFFELGFIGLVLFCTLLSKPMRIVTSKASEASESDRSLMMGFIVGYLSVVIYLFFAGTSNSIIFVWAYIGLMLKHAYFVKSAHEQTQNA